jgi:DNA-binding PadR family transcriptional regulator
MAPKDLKALLLLESNPAGLYGSEVVALSYGFVGRGTIYTLLARLVDRGLVRAVDEPPTAALQIARTRHFITDEGSRALQDYLAIMNLDRRSQTSPVAGGSH